MTRDLRWRIISLQVVMVLVFVFGAGLALWAGNFAHDEIRNELAPQQITFPADAKSGLPDNLSQYAGQQVLNGDQAKAYADNFIGLHLSKIGQGKPYSYWSGQAQIEQDATKKAADEATANTLFKGETLRTMLTQAWAFWFVGDIALYAAIGLAIAAIFVAAALAFELFVAPNRAAEMSKAGTLIRTTS